MSDEETLAWYGTKYSRFKEPEPLEASLIRVIYKDGSEEIRTAASFYVDDQGHCRKCGADVWWDGRGLRSSTTDKLHGHRT